MDPFDTIGLSPTYDLDLKALEARYRDLQRALHPDKHVQASAGQRRESLSRSVDVNDAYRVLKDDLRRADALLTRYRGGTKASTSAQDPAFLMEIMELREALSEAKAAADLDATARLSKQVAAHEREARDALRSAFQELSQAASPDALQSAENAISRLTYYRRFQDEVASIEEDALG